MCSPLVERVGILSTKMLKGNSLNIYHWIRLFGWPMVNFALLSIAGFKGGVMSRFFVLSSLLLASVGICSTFVLTRTPRVVTAYALAPRGQC